MIKTVKTKWIWFILFEAKFIKLHEVINMLLTYTAMICSFNVTFWTSIDYIRLIIIDHLKIFELVKITIIIFIFIEILTRYFLIFSLYSKNENKQQTKHSDFRFKIQRYHLARFKVTKFSHWNKYFRFLLQSKGQKFLYMERIYYMGNPNQKPIQRKFQNSSSRQYHSRDVKGPTRARLI